jgi:hypothetical protein
MDDGNMPPIHGSRKDDHAAVARIEWPRHCAGPPATNAA